MKRWCVCKRYFDAESNAWEPTVAKYTANFRCWTVADKPWQLCQVGVSDLTAMNADPEIIVLPDLTLDATWGTLPANVRNIALNRLGGYGVDTSLIKTSSTIRGVLILIGRQCQPTMNPERGDVADF